MIIAWLLLSVLVGFIGAGRNIGFFGAFILSLILSPLIGGIITLASTSKATATMASEAKKQTVALQNLQGKSIPEQLQDLAALRDAGTITEEEYNAAKSKILG